jgi:FkbM family methyltransferase
MTLPILHLIQTRDGLMAAPRYDRYVTPALEVYGEYSPDERALLCSLVQKGDIVCQVGANVGALTLPLAHAVGPTGRVLALEPQRVIYQALSANLAINNLWHVEAKQAAAGAVDGVVSMPEVDYQRPGNFGGISVSTEATTQRVPMVTLDKALASLPALALLHLDCEGHELDVLRGALATIQRLRPVLYVEVDRPDVREGLPALLAPLGYVLRSHAPLLFSAENYRGQTRNIFQDDSGVSLASFNALCVPSERAAYFAPLLDVLPEMATPTIEQTLTEDVVEEAA